MSDHTEDLTADDRRHAAALFKAYDVRGIVPEELTPVISREIGRALVATLEPETVVVGRDMRISSPVLAAALIEGIRDAGSNAVDIGMVSTDALYFAIGKYGYPAGVMVTASHNPPEYNGFKIAKEEAQALSLTDGLDKIRDRVVSGDLPPAVLGLTKRGDLVERDILDDYAKHMLSLVDVSKMRPLRIAIDAGNGMAGLTVPRVFRDLPVEVVPLYFEPDGTFPNHPANPIEPANTAELRRVVVEQGLDLGAAFDGDADRVFLVDEQGQLVGGDMLTALVASRMLDRYPGAAIVYNLICSRGVPGADRRQRTVGQFAPALATPTSRPQCGAKMPSSVVSTPATSTFATTGTPTAEWPRCSSLSRSSPGPTSLSLKSLLRSITASDRVRSTARSPMLTRSCGPSKLATPAKAPKSTISTASR